MTLEDDKFLMWPELACSYSRHSTHRSVTLSHILWEGHEVDF